MAATTLQPITPQQQTTTMTDIKEFLVPTILSVNLKKTTEDHLPILENENSNSPQDGGEISRCSTPCDFNENVQKNFPILLDHENSSVNLEILDSGEDDEDVVEMAPLRNKSSRPGGKRTSSFLLAPFFKPVDHNLAEGNKENPVLKALFGSKTNSPKHVPSWVPGDRSTTTTSTCHPFKKTDLSHDPVVEEVPVQVPKSLLKKPLAPKHSPPTRSPSRSPSRSPTRSPLRSPLRRSPTRSSGVLKEIQLASGNLEGQNVSAPSITTNQTPTVSPKSDSTKTTESSKLILPSQVESKSSYKKKKSSSQGCIKPRPGYSINSERLMQLKGIVDSAIKEHKVYSMTGCYTSVRNALRQRGWIEKIDSDFKGRRRQNKYEEIGIYDAAFQFVQKNSTLAAMRNSSQCNTNFVNNDQIRYSGQGEAEIINRMLRNITEDLCWLSRPYPYYCWKDIGKYDMVNRLPKAYFSNKVGLCNSLQQIQWFFEPGVCSTQYPRTYNISLKDEYEAFKDDFRITSCICMLKWLTSNYKNGGEKAVRSPDGKVDVNIIEFALRRCAEFVRSKEHEDIDLPETPTIWEHQWDHFLTQYYKIINDNHILRDCKEDPPIKVIITNAQTMLNMVKPHWPQLDIEGINNFWIVKPGGRCCGNGIVIKNNLEQILTIVNPTITRETRYVVQKYIERPLLIYNTKFDIRQWFLVTNVYPLTIWMYKESYLRFCSQPFTLKSTHESIHLCNNAVQRRYKNARRDRGLPDENMWDCYTFQTYLKAIGHPDAWDKYIYPGMKEGFIGALLASQDSMERRKNCFELYGADFMISDTLTDGPWLIEINSNPAMDSSTSVTARMCPQVLEDIVKVVIDRRDDKNASTGAFEMIFKQNCPPIPPYLGMSLSIKGKKVYRPSSDPKNAAKKSKNNNSSDTLVDTDTEDDTSCEENIVQKKCTTDFMQPIKTLIETIQGGFSPSDLKDNSTDMVPCSSAEETDSVNYDSDSTDESGCDREIALEGKEMELKKKNDKKLKTDAKGKKDEEEISEDKKKEMPHKRKKVDWIRKNIENIKTFHAHPLKLPERHEKGKEEHFKRSMRQRECLELLNDENLCSKSCECEKKSAAKTTHEELEHIFREEIVKMLDTIECKQFMGDVGPAENNNNDDDDYKSCSDGDNEAEEQKEPEEKFESVSHIENVWESEHVVVELINKAEEEINKVLSKSFHSLCPMLSGNKDEEMVDRVVVAADDPNKMNCDEISQYETVIKVVELDAKCELKTETMETKNHLADNNMSLLSISDFTDCDFDDTDRTGTNNQQSNDSMEVGDGFSDFDSKFERELRELEVRETDLKEKLDMHIVGGLSIIPQGMSLKKKMRGLPRWNNSKTSMEYFREWKYKVDETRRTCEDMLAKLRVFKEANSKLKFQDALRKRMEDEAKFIKRLKEYRSTKNYIKLNKNVSKKVVVRSKNGEENSPRKNRFDPLDNPREYVAEYITPSTTDRAAKVMALCKEQAVKYGQYCERLKNKKLDQESRFTIRLYDCDLPPAHTPLAINSETGAVRNVSQSLPKIKQRNRPLLPNGSSGHGRKMEGVTDKVMRKKFESRVK